MQMCPEGDLVEKVKTMNHYELMAMRVSLLEALQSSEFKINLDDKHVSSQMINKVL